MSPGSGLGRLAYEIAKKGYISQGNEFSFFMLIAGSFLLNKFLFLLDSNFFLFLFTFFFFKKKGLLNQMNLKFTHIFIQPLMS